MIPNTWDENGDSKLGSGIYFQVANCDFTPIWGLEPPQWNVFSQWGMDPAPLRGFVTSKTAEKICEILNPSFAKDFASYMQPAPQGVIGYAPNPPKWFIEYPGAVDRADAGEVAIALCNHGVQYTVDLLKRNLKIA